MTGKVWLLGAGPGDEGLLTLRGKEVLSRAEVVVYDALVGYGILSLIPEGAELIFAGKRAGSHTLRQEEINRILLEEAEKGRRVVRLKGGDPFVFGRGGEELELLSENGIPFEIVPGVTSAFAVPAYFGIPVTHRDYAGSVHVVTGHYKEGSSVEPDYEALVRTGGTLVFLMGISRLSAICEGLLSAGMAADTPSAVLEKGTGARQRMITAPLSELSKKAEEAQAETPAIIIVGEVTGLARKDSWVENRPLFGKRILVTRPVETASEFAGLLRERGAEVIELPAIAIRPVEPDAVFLSEIERLRSGGYDWLVFTSPNGVRIFFERILETGDLRAVLGCRFAVIGQGTEKALRSYGIKADFVPSVYDGKTLGRELSELCKPGERLLIPRAVIGNPELTEELGKGAGLSITDLPIYETVYQSDRFIDVYEEFRKGEIDLAVFTSASTVRGFAGSLPERDLSGITAVCIGKQTKEAARGYGMRTAVAEKATLMSLLECVESVCAGSDKGKDHISL